MKKLRLPALLLAAALLLLPGCNIIKVNPDRDGAQIVAVVAGEKITKLDVYNALNYSLTQKVDSWNQASFNQYKAQMLESLIANKVVFAKAKEQGMYNFTPDEQKKIDDAVNTYKTSYYDIILNNYKEKAKTDPSIKPEEKANADVDSYRKQQEDSAAYDKIKKTVTDAVKPADADLQKAYNDDVTSEKTSYDATPDQAVTDDNGTATPVVYIPLDGFVRVRQILIPLPSDIQSQISSDRNTNTDASNKAANDLRATELAKIKAKADEALQKAQGASGDLKKLDQLIVDYGNGDPGMATKPEGYLVFKDTKYYMQDFTDASMKLTDIGKPSELVATDYGYHIIWLTSKLTKGTIPYDQVKDAVTKTVTSSQQDTAWQNAVTGWMTDYANKIQRYIGRLNN